MIGGGSGEGSVVVYKLLVNSFFIGDRIGHIVEVAVQICHYYGFFGVGVGECDVGVGTTKVLANFSRGSFFAF